MSAALNAAVDRGHLARNPVRASEAPRYSAPEFEPLSPQEARRVLGVASSRHNGARWSVALALGLRQAEALGLRWEEIDLDKGTLAVRAQLQHLPWQHGCGVAGAAPACGRDPGRCPDRRGGGPVLVPLKSASGRRTLALPAPLALQLADHRAHQGQDRPRQAGWVGDLVFTRADGSPVRKETDSAEWHRILGLAGIRQARLHDARHTAATLLLVQGVPAGVAMRLLGHADVRILARYQHVIDEAGVESTRVV